MVAIAIPMSPRDVWSLVNAHNQDDVIIIDCRSFGFDRSAKIPGAHSINCNALVKRRSGGQTIPVGNIVTDAAVRKRLLSGEIKTVVAYDKGTQDYSAAPSDSDLKLVMRSLSEYKDTSGSGLPPRQLSNDFFFIAGGFDKYEEEYPDWVERTRTTSPGLQLPCLSAAPSSNSQHSGPVEILSYLYLSDAEHASRAETLDKLGIRWIVNVSRRASNHFPDKCTYYNIPVDDRADTDLGRYFDEAYAFIDAVRIADGRVLVHCDRGISRSAAIVIAYLMRRSGLSVDEAYTRVRARRDIIDPNLGFMSQLMEYEKKLTAQRHRMARVQPLVTPEVSPDVSPDAESKESSVKNDSSESLPSLAPLHTSLPPTSPGCQPSSAAALSNCSQAFQSAFKTTSMIFNMGSSQSPLSGGSSFYFPSTTG